MEIRCGASGADVDRFAVVRDAREIAWRQTRIEKTMKSWWSIKRRMRQNFFHSHDPFAVAVEAKRRGDARLCAVSADEITSLHPARRAVTIEPHHQLAFQFRVFR